MSPTRFRLHRDAALRSPRQRHRVQPVHVLRVEPPVWAEAMRLAGGDATRLRVVSAKTVVVTNRSLRQEKHAPRVLREAQGLRCLIHRTSGAAQAMPHFAWTPVTTWANGQIAVNQAS